ncbi:MAG TPA: site-2 protease family protein [Ktedonobacteraceae bacterium]|nr:site-2 protease family protein [Ktedonobacteraceae bacterium]
MRSGINVLLALMVIVSFLGAIPLHEWAHVIMASWLGDHTPRAEGRQTLSLRAHIDPVGTLMCVILAFQGYVGLGWGRPVKPDPWKMRVGTDRGVLLVACAGLLFSLIVGLAMAGIARLLLQVAYITANPLMDRLLQFVLVFACVNIGIAVLNLLPFYPLDGYQILYALLPSKQAVQFSRSSTYGPFIILILFFFAPFLASLANLDWFPLFRLPYYIWLASISLASLVMGGDLTLVAQWYLH